jgi:helix-turn-helix protein
MSKQQATDELQQNPTEKVLGDFLTPDETAGELKVCRRTLDRWRRLGEGPPVTKIGRAVYYRRSTLRAWVCDREQNGSV